MSDECPTCPQCGHPIDIARASEGACIEVPHAMRDGSVKQIARLASFWFCSYCEWCEEVTARRPLPAASFRPGTVVH
jgi:hypothetical protein